MKNADAGCQLAKLCKQLAKSSKILASLFQFQTRPDAKNTKLRCHNSLCSLSHNGGSINGLRDIKAKLLNTILSCEQLCYDDADGCKHGSAAVVQLPSPHFRTVSQGDAKRNRIAIVANRFCRLCVIVFPNEELENT